MTNKELLSDTIDSLRFPLTVGVVFIHFSMAEGFCYNGIAFGVDNPPFFFFVVNLFSEVLARVCVPLFFIISGFLFFFHLDFCWKAYSRKLRSRVRTLLLPYIVWNIFAAIVILGKSLLPFYPDVTIHFSFIRLLNTFFYNIDGNGIIVGPSFLVPSMACPLNIPMWFVRDLMVMVLLAPIHYWLIKSVRGTYIVMLGVLWFFSSLFFSSDSYVGMLVMASFFFSWGAYYSIRNVSFVASFRRLKFAPIIYVVVAIADTLTKNDVFNEYLNKVGILLGGISVVILISNLVEQSPKGINRTLSGCSFFIFSLHTLFMGDLGKLVFKLFDMPGDNSCLMLLIYFIVPISVIVICFFLYVCLHKYTPSLCEILVGNRR